MASGSAMTRPVQEDAPEGTRLAAAAGAVSNAAGTVSGAVSGAAGTAAAAAGDAAACLPDLADLAERGLTAFQDVNRRVQAGTDQMLTLGTAVSFGFAAGLLVGGANRVLVAAALVPVAMMGLTLLDRAAEGRPSAGVIRTKPADR